MATKLTPSSPIALIPNIGPVYRNKLEQIGIKSVSDLLYTFPFRYEDLSVRKSIAESEIGETVTIQASLWQITKIRTKTGRILIKATVNDASGSSDVIWFNQVYLLAVLKPNTLLNLAGKVGMFGNKKTLINPSYEIIKNNLAPIHTERLVPIYSESSGISSKWFRTKIYQLLKTDKVQAEEILDNALIKSENLVGLDQALSEIHFPTSLEKIQRARTRLVFDELILLHLRNLRRKKAIGQESTILTFKLPGNKLKQFESKLPFKLTPSQQNSIAEILTDLESGKGMNRLLQGEVGSGKTVVSCFPMLACIESGYRAAFLAPTEILAKQHFQTVKTLLGDKFKIELLTGSVKIKDQNFDILVGTHAILNKDLIIDRLGLVIVDEQQRFGVLQRSFLKNQAQTPGFLTMTATPIPRTLALTLYGNLDFSVLDAIPSGRKPVKTYFVPNYKRDAAYNFVKKEIDKGGQAFIICPLIELSETLVSVKSAREEFENLKNNIFKDYKLALLHGKLKNQEKDSVISAFRENKIQLLVSTPVVEVGIDIPNASVIVIEAAERFGLASLHQLRGRVGRGERQSYCLLFTSSTNIAIQRRLKLMEKFSNGLQLAEMDLENRGPGDIFGTAQSGHFNLKLAESVTLDLIQRSKVLAEKIISKPLNSNLEKQLKLVETSEVISD